MSDAIEAVSQRLDNFAAFQSRDTAEMGPDAGDFIAASAAAIQGGKRLRARFCLTGWRAVAETGSRSTPATESVIAAAAALEIFHAAALVHDDLIDNSDTRRGRAASHRALEQAHRDAGWHGDAASFGRSSAILLGDLLVAWSDDLLEAALRGHPFAAATRAEYALMRRDVTIGQLLDITEESAWSVSPPSALLERALRVVSLKSARYSVTEPIVLGATLAGADDALVSALREFGNPVGMAFQLRDDVLGVFGDPQVTGKPAGDDLREGKRTALIAITRENLSVSQRTELDAALGDPTLSDDAVTALQQMIRDSGALERIESMIAEYTEAAEVALARAALQPEATTALRTLADAAITRSA